MTNILVIGSGVSGIATAISLKKRNIPFKIFEKNDYVGGLCSSFSINGFKFDTFVHFSFSEKEEFNNIILKNTPYLSHNPEAYNYYNGFFIAHPLQDNLKQLPFSIKMRCVFSLIFPEKIRKIQNYSDWLLANFGSFFSTEFAKKYTLKYWGVSADKIGIDWIGKRIHCPNKFQIIKGALFENKQNYYYAKKMRYPEQGEFLSFFKSFYNEISVEKKEVVSINIKKKEVLFNDGEVEHYSYLFSSIPLSEMKNIIEDIPQDIKNACDKLKWTQGIIVSIGFKREIKTQGLWNYIYDSDILISRIYFPHLKSRNNVPEGCSSLQAEIYFSNDTPLRDLDEIKKDVIKNLIKMKMFSVDDILFSDVRYFKYANIIFTKETYENRDSIIFFLRKNNIIPIGRFGKWEYFWSDQAFLDGKKEGECFSYDE